MSTTKIKKAISFESFIFLVLFLLFFGIISSQMGLLNMINTLMNTAYSLLIDTVFYIMAIAVLAGAISSLFSEFGVVSLLNKGLSFFIKPIYGLPGASSIGVFATYMSDNPAILTLAKNDSFKRYFKKYQLPALTNLGTSFGMGLIISTFILSLSNLSNESYVLAVLVGNIGAFLGSIVSVRLMLRHSYSFYKEEELLLDSTNDAHLLEDMRLVRNGNAPTRALDALLEGGKNGVDISMQIIPGVLIICTLVMLLSNGASIDGSYTGAAYEGIAFLPWLGSTLSFIITPLFGFQDPSAIAIPLTSLGAAGAAIGLLPSMIRESLVSAKDMAVFCAMCMTYSGFLSTHVAMMDTLGFRNLTGKAILYHTIGGLVAGISANVIYTLLLWLL